MKSNELGILCDMRAALVQKKKREHCVAVLMERSQLLEYGNNFNNGPICPGEIFPYLLAALNEPPHM